jgi:16S rRNA (cytosine1402-N4)-methyltransferase
MILQVNYIEIELNKEYHIPVLLNESVAALMLQEGKYYVDVTFGGGGHSSEILKKCPNCKLIAFDQDADAALNAHQISHSNFTFIESNFRYLKKHLKALGVERIDGLIADLGVSSHQIDTAERGFSTRFDATLDMRMDQNNPVTAAKILNEYSPKQLQYIFSQYGEVTNAKTLANIITNFRENTILTTIQQFKKIILPIAPNGKEHKYLAQVFQALRIEVNQELIALKELLTQAAELLNTGGRLVIISYHSLEDRIVKNYIAKGTFGEEPEKDLYGNFYKPFREVTKKPIQSGEDEIKRNIRARSAKLRVAEKT